MNWLRRSYYLYAVCLPGLALAGLVVTKANLPFSIHPLLTLLLLFPLACYWAFTTELVPFPTHWRAALTTTLLVPVGLLTAVYFGQQSIWYVFIMQAGTEVLGVMGLITVLVIQKMWSGHRNWFAAGVLLLGSAVAIAIGLYLFLYILPASWVSYVGTTLSLGMIAWRYYGYLTSPHRNPHLEASGYIIIGVLATGLIPLLAWLTTW